MPYDSTHARVSFWVPPRPTSWQAALGALPATTPAADVPPGRGYARLGAGPVHRLQVPSTPDPYDDATSDTDRKAVLALLPPRTTPADAEPVEATPAETKAAAAKALEAEAVEEEQAEAEPVPADAVVAEAP